MTLDEALKVTNRRVNALDNVRRLYARVFDILDADEGLIDTVNS